VRLRETKSGRSAGTVPSLLYDQEEAGATPPQ
jgi:hypothetical protein